LGLGGKRIRPVLTLMTTEVFNADYKKSPQRWLLSVSTSLWFMMTLWMMRRYVVDIKLFMRSGMFWNFVWRCDGLAYQYFEQYEAPNFMQLAKLFSKTALKSAKGSNGMFETDVTISEYLKMIEYKKQPFL
jgi:geranylgeranyl diphosphate synthase type II